MSDLGKEVKRFIAVPQETPAPAPASEPVKPEPTREPA